MKFPFVFPGQGSQSVGMLNAFADNPVVRATLEEASTALGQDIGKLIAEGPAEDLNLTTNTQPVMLTAAVAVYRAWLDAGGPAPAFGIVGRGAQSRILAGSRTGMNRSILNSDGARSTGTPMPEPVPPMSWTIRQEEKADDAAIEAIRGGHGQYARTFGLKTSVFRMSCIYGPHQFGTEDQGWVAHFILAALRGDPLTIYGDGHQVRDILFVEDLVDAMLLAQARELKAERGAPPLLLLDEVVAHLDAGRRAALFDEISHLQAQAWLTGTDDEFFSTLRGRARFFRVADAHVTPR